ncbi:MAG TPA: DUF6519 domain-containing protein [Pyrinomonadaceae bacterium]|nr:DUF6519 domain-containing protein [Pyrinomonadaceae bacterium]
MKGDFSRDTFDPRKRYSGVLMQQGRVQVDADWNEQLEIGRYRIETEARDVIGHCGVPKNTDGFKLTPVRPEGISHSTDLAISNGRIYVDGLLCELEPAAVSVTFDLAQPKQAIASTPTVDGYEFAKGQWVEMSADDVADKALLRVEGVDADKKTLSFDDDISAYHGSANPVVRRVVTYLSQPDLPKPPFSVQPGGDPDAVAEIQPSSFFSIAYLHVWEQHVTALDDSLIREKALGGPDTATRSKTVWQLEILPLELDGNAQFDCQTSFPEWDALVAPSSGTMNARTQPAVDPKDPCLLPPSAGYRRLENQLYRVEVQKGGTRDAATFKWSRENGSVQTTVEKVDGATITVADLGKDEVLGFKGGDWVELVTDETELKGAPRALALIDTIDPDLREITLDASAADLATTPRVKLRRWDQKGATATDDGVAMTAGWIDLEGGIQVEFSEGTYRAGDYWLIPARTATGEIEWPPFNVPNGDPQPQPPRGIRHHYCRLATLKFDEVISVRDDCRDFFPPLTDICAEDVCFDNEVCQMPGVETVQDAIENLCARNDLKHHNKHLHGWGIVCGLQVHCGPDNPNDPPRRHVTVRAGYALDCEGNDIIHRQDDSLDVLQMIAEHNQEFPNDPLVIVDGRDGEVCLVLNNAGAEKPYSLEPHDPDADSWKSILKGTIWMDFYNDCLGNLVDVFKEEMKPLPGEEDLPVTPAQKRVTTLFNLLVQLFNKSNGRFVYLSGENGLDDPKTEHIILRNLYEKLRAVVQSQTFCGQFDSAPFPEYPFTKLNDPTQQPPYIPTLFGRNSHTRLRVHPSGRFAYTMGVGPLINVYDLITNEMVAEVKFPDDAAQVRDVAFSQDGKQLYAAATISNSASLFAVADIDGPNFKWHIPAVSCSTRLVTLATTKNAPNKVYGIGRGKGLYELDLNNLNANITPLFPFNATGHLVIAEQGSQTFVFATANETGGPTFVYDRVLRFALHAKQSPPFVFNLQANQESLTGRDDIAVGVVSNAHRLYVVTDPPVTSNNKQMLVFANALAGTLTPAGFFDLEDTTTIRLAYNSVTDFLMVTYADRYCVRLFGGNGLVQEIEFRHPVQVSPVSIAMARDPFSVDRNRVYVLNNVSRTITSIPAAQFSPSKQIDLNALAQYRSAILEAFVNLFGGLLQYLKDCLCEHLLVRCPECTPEDKLYLACITIRGGEVYKICNFSMRKYVHSFPTVEYWLSLVPVIPLVAKAVEKFCCSILPDFFGRFKASTETQAANTFGSQSMFAATSLFQGMNFGNVLGKLFGQGQQFGSQLFKDMLECAANDQDEPPGLTQASIAGMQVDDATRFLAERNIEVAGVETYDPCNSLAHLLQSLFAPKRLAGQSSVNLVVQNGTVQSVTPAGAAAGFGARAGGGGGGEDASQTGPSAFAGLVGGGAGAGDDVKKELDKLKQEVASSREQFEKALAERDDTIGRLQAQAEEMQETLKALAEPQEPEKPGGSAAGGRRQKGSKKAE